MIRSSAIATGCCRLAEFQDYDGAVNGLQVENRGGVTRLAAAVDTSLATVRLALTARADLLIVHHGLFWAPSHPWTSKRYELLRLLTDHNLAVYNAHLPLDAHPRLGNNARLAAALGLRGRRPFFFDHGQFIGCQAVTRIARDDLAKRFRSAVGAAPRVIPGGPPVCRRVGVVTGGAGSELRKAAAEGVDTFITGEGPRAGRGIGTERALRRPLRDGDIRCQDPGEARGAPIRTAVDVSGSPDGPLTRLQRPATTPPAAAGDGAEIRFDSAARRPLASAPL